MANQEITTQIPSFDPLKADNYESVLAIIPPVLFQSECLPDAAPLRFHTQVMLNYMKQKLLPEAETFYGGAMESLQDANEPATPQDIFEASKGLHDVNAFLKAAEETLASSAPYDSLSAEAKTWVRLVNLFAEAHRGWYEFSRIFEEDFQRWRSGEQVISVRIEPYLPVDQA